MAATVNTGPTHGKDSIVYLDGVDLSGQSREFRVSATAQVSDRTGMGGSVWRSFLEGLKTWTAGITALFYGGTGSVDQTLRAGVNTEVGNLWLGVHGGGVGRMCAFAEKAIPTSAEVTSPLEDLSQLVTALQGQGALEWGHIISPKATVSEFPDDSDGVDGGAQSSAGGVAFLQVFAITGGTSIEVELEDSADDDTYAQLVAFSSVAQASAPTSERKTVSGTVERYVRRTVDDTGDVTSAVLATGFVRL